MQQVAATPRIGRSRWPRRGQRPLAGEEQVPEGSFLAALAGELDLAPIDLVGGPFAPRAAWLVDAGRVRADPPAAAPRDDAADRGAFHTRLMPPGFSVRSFANGYAPGALFLLVG